MVDIITREIEIPNGVTISLKNDYEVTVKGEKGELSRLLFDKSFIFKVQENKLVIEFVGKKFSKKQKMVVHTFRAHIKNMIKGVSEGFVYKMKICSGHFPMNVSIKNNELIIKNFMGEKVPRVVKLNPLVETKLDGNDIIMNGINKEDLGNQASKIEKLTFRSSFDSRIFQDGVYITQKDHKIM